jgi:sugar phosphate permease
MSLIKREIRLWNFYYGWILVGVAMVSMAFWFGIRATFSVFYVALLEDFSWSRGEAAGVQSMALVTYTIMAPIVGGLIDRFGPRRIIVPGILLLASGLILCSSIKTLGQFYLLYGVVVGTGVTSVAIVSYAAILAHWFEKKRGLANGLAVSGIGLGTFIFVPLSQYCISLWGWRLTFVILGGLVLIILLSLNALLLRHKPQDLGLYPDGIKEGEQPKDGELEVMDFTWSETDWTLKSAFRTGRFWYLMFFSFLVAIVIYVILVHHVRFFVDKGIDKTMAAFIFSLVGIISLAFRVFWGWISDFIGREKAYTLGAMCIFLGICSLILLEISGERQLVYLFIIFFGAGWGVTGSMFISVAADLFQGRGFGLIYGILEGVIGIGGALGAWVPGFIYDKTQSYQWAFGLAAFMTMLSCLFVWLAAPRKVRSTRRKARVMDKD